MAHTSLRLKILALCTLVVLGGCEIPLLSSGLVAAAGLASVLQKKEKKEARILLSPTGVTYGDQVIVLTSTPKIITVSNTGNANLVVNNAFVSGADASSFVISNECLVAVSPGTSCRVNVSFAPKTVGAKAGTLVLNSNAANTAEPVLLTGNGFLPPPPQVTPASLTLNVLGITETRAEIQVTAIDQYQL
ncbi:MAG: choice-of-anchor D domain-containing protein, partial [Gammaproteobacteria bacterium]|nr:choice-of-anchor D domain-containing protein [Gammaproteobacteria bacterium]